VIRTVSTKAAFALPGMSQGMKVAGPLLFVSGQVALDDRGELVGHGDFEQQATQVMRNLEQVLIAGGAGLGTVVRIGVFITDRKYLQAWRTLRSRYFSDPFPASTLVIADLITPDLLIEVEAVAAVIEGRVA
jgi:enamine deaminase RidA (YjgF/YER057c/UK114 family)